jgi:hypothetical protein
MARNELPSALISNKPSAETPPAQTPRALRVLLAVFVCSILPSALIALIGIVASAFEKPSPSLDGMFGSLYAVTFLGTMITAPVVILLALPSYLAARRLGWANSRVACICGAVIGAFLLLVISEYHGLATVLGAVIGGLTGVLFSVIVGVTTPTHADC